jgi:uncharacterized membrane protein
VDNTIPSTGLPCHTELMSATVVTCDEVDDSFMVVVLGSLFGVTLLALIMVSTALVFCVVCKCRGVDRRYKTPRSQRE